MTRGRVRLSQVVMTREGVSDATLQTKSSRIPDRKIREMPAKKVYRVIDVQKNNQLKYSFTGVSDTDPRACFNRSTWSPAVNLQQPPLGTSHLILGDSLVRVLQNLRTSWITTAMAFGGATIAHQFRMMELMNPGRILNVMILVGTNNISKSSDEEEAQWESMMVCLFTTLWQIFNCTVPMSTKTLTTTRRRHNEGVIRWNNILRNAGRMILMDIEHKLRAIDQARLTSDGIHFDSIEGQAWLNRFFQERFDEREVEFVDTGVLKKEETSNKPVISTFVPPNLETRLGTVPAVTNFGPQSSSEPGQRTYVKGRLGEAPTRRTINPRRRLGPVNPTAETTSTSRSDTRSETTSTSREERRPDRSSLMWSRLITSPWHMYKEDLMKLNLQTVSFAADAMRMLNGARLSVNGLYSIITCVDWLIAADINFSSATALRFADLEGLPSNNTMGPVNARPLQDVKLNHDEGNREKRPGRFLMTRAPIGQHVKIFRQMKAPPGHVKKRAYPKQVNQEGDVQRYGGLKAIKKDETIFAAYDKAEMRKAKIMIVASSDFVYTSNSVLADVIRLAAVDMDLIQSVSMASVVQRQTEMHPITIVFAGINDHLHSRGFLSRLREPTTTESAVWPATKDIFESMGEVVDTLKEGAFTKITPRAVFALSPGYAHLPDGLKFVFAVVALLSEGKYVVIISAPNRAIEMENLRLLRAELPAVWSDISNPRIQ